MTLDRRAALCSLGAVLLAGASGLPVLAQSAPSTFGAVSVDVSPLREKGLGSYADRVGVVLQREMAVAFADRVRPGSPRLVVRIDAISMRDYVGGDSRQFGSGAPNDYLEGEALVLGRRGEILLRVPQLSALPASSGGAWYDPDSGDRRVAAIARHYAGWLRRRL